MVGLCEIIAKLEEITGIEERRYVTEELTTSDIAAIAAEKALEGEDKESLDYIIVGTNLGELQADNNRTDFVPAVAARVKHKLRIQIPETQRVLLSMASRSFCEPRHP